MVKRSERIEALICDGRVSEERVDSVVVEWMTIQGVGADVEDDLGGFYARGVEFGMENAGRSVTYAVANGVLYLFLGTEEELLKKLDAP